MLPLSGIPKTIKPMNIYELIRYGMQINELKSHVLKWLYINDSNYLYDCGEGIVLDKTACHVS